MLALALGKTVAEMQSSMTQAEFSRWVEFYKLFPFDDLHRFHRPAALVASRHGQDVQAMLDWLAPDPLTVGMADADLRTMRAMGFTRPQGA